MELKEWTKHYIKFKDAMKKKIKNIAETEFGYEVEEKDGNKVFYVIHHIEDGIHHLEELKGEKIYFVTPNTQTNVKQTIQSWDTLKEHKELTIIFANPKTNESWLLHPNTHANVSEINSLEQGLQSLYEGVNPAE